jgi:GNAT superfamily N-acetyltransferase
MKAMQITLRPARTEDFDYCVSLYFAGMKRVIRELNLDRVAQAAALRQQWDVTQVRIIALDDADIGWLQSTTRADALFLAQLFVDGSFRRRGIGTEVMNRLISEATRARQAVTLGVVKITPPYGSMSASDFVSHTKMIEKFYMRRNPNTEAPN